VSRPRRARAPFPRRPIPFLWRYVRLRPLHFGLLFAIIVGAASCAVGVQYGMKLIVDAMNAPDRASAAVWMPLGLFLGLIAIENLLWRSGGWLGCRAIVATGVDLRLDLFQHLTGQPMRYFAENYSGALGNRITQTATATAQIFSALTWNILPPVVDFLGAVVVLSIIDVRMAGALVGFVAIVASLILVFGSRGRPLHQRFAEEGARTNGRLVDVVANVWTVKAFAARQRQRERFERELGTEAEAQKRSWMFMEKTRLMHDASLWLMAGTMLLWAVLGWRSGQLTAGDVVVISALTFRILHGSRDLAFSLINVSQQFGGITESLRVIGEPHAVTDPEDGRTFRPLAGAITFRDVRYTHAGGQQVFDGFNLQIPAGQRVGIVGPSGGGKSTLISLIQRLDDVQGGAIEIDGQDVRAVTQDSLRAKIAVVPQEIALFSRSIFENIRYGRPDASTEEVYQAARQAYCEDFIRALPEGWDTQIGERGVMLSGGQRQRLGIARAFLKDAPILVLDEATSALDTHSEIEIQKALEQLMRGRTVLAVAHRLSTVMGFDRILVLVAGRVAEDGSPETLRARGGVFDSLWRLQGDTQPRKKNRWGSLRSPQPTTASS
jgi:ATP-binding cassette subfamily B protein